MPLRPTEPPPKRPDTPPPSELPTGTAPGAAAGEGRTFTPGQILGERYRMGTFLGRGGMGEVWHAFDLKLRVEVALKSLLRERIKNERSLELLRREVRSAREVVSPNVCRIFDLVEVDGQELVSMEYIDGMTLVAMLRERGALPLREAREIASQFLAGLEAIHKAGLVHRDVKPENVMITRAGRVVLMDFGLAKPAVEEGAQTVSGTLAYMSPEQMRGEALDARADVFAAGIVLAEMVSSEGIRDHPSRESLWRGAHQDPPQVPETPWRPVLLKAVAKDREKRYASARALTRALDEMTLRVEGAEDLRPYPGLASFTEADAEYFFGREAEVEQMWRKLQQPHLQALIGPSGAGKSSFLRAGVIPALPEGWRCVICTPGSSPLLVLARAIVPELLGDPEAIRRLLEVEDREAMVSVVSGWRRRHEEVLLIVDQFEELFTLNPPEVQVRFAELLGRLALEADVHVLLSMRDDFLIHCHDHEALTPIFSELTPLKAPTGAALRRALVQPALKCGYRFEDDALVDEMLREVAQERGALPLLAFAMSQLWEKRDRDTGLLTRKAYEEIGGVGGALAQHAEATLERIGTERQPVVREIFRNLVTAQGTRAAREKEELLSVFEDRQRAEKVLGELINARLLTSYEVQEKEEEESRTSQRVEIIHESLLVAWPRLVRWQTQDADSAQLRDQLRQAAGMWEERGRPADLLWTGTSYREFRVWRERYPGGLTATEEAFAGAMVQHGERLRRRRRVASGSAFALLLLILGVVGWLWNRAVNESLRAEAQELYALGQLELERDPTKALAYTIASLERVDAPAVRRFALKALWRGPTYFKPSRTWSEGGGNALSIDFSADNRWLAVGAYTTSEITLWPGDGGEFTTLSGPGGQVEAVKFGSRSDQLISSAGLDDGVSIWSVPDRELIRALKLEPSDAGRLRLLHISSDGRRLLTLRCEGSGSPCEIHEWSLNGGAPTLRMTFEMDQMRFDEDALSVDSEGKRIAYVKGETDLYLLSLSDLAEATPRRIGSHDDQRITAIAFDKGSERFASGDQSGRIQIWSADSRSAVPLRTLHGPGKVWGLRFVRTGALLASAHDGGMALVWDLVGPPAAEPLELLGFQHLGAQAQTYRVEFDRSGRWLATTAYIPGLTLWSLEHPAARILRGHAGGVWGLAFAPDGSFILSEGVDETLRRWDLKGDATGSGQLTVSAEVGAFATLKIDPTGRHVITMAQDGISAAIIPLDGSSPRVLGGFTSQIQSAAISPDGRHAAVSAGRFDKSEMFIRVWDLETDQSRILDIGYGSVPEDLLFTQDGGLIFVSGGNVHRWDLADGTHRIIVEGSDAIWHGGVAMSRDGRRLLTTATGGFYFHDLETGVSRHLASHWGNSGTAALDPSGTIAVTSDGSGDGVVRVGRVNGEEPHLLLGHERTVNNVAISPDLRWIASSSADGTVRLWPMPDLEKTPLHTLPYEELLKRLRTFTNVRVTPDEESPTGYRFDLAEFPGWARSPTR